MGLAAGCVGPGLAGMRTQVTQDGRLQTVAKANGTSVSGPYNPVDLVNVWRVTADGESPNTWLRLDGWGWQIWRNNDGPIEGGWLADGNNFVASKPWGVTAPSVDDWSAYQVPWLAETHSYRQSGDGWEFLDANGTVVARLRIDGVPPANPNVWDQGRMPPEITDQIRARFAAPKAKPSAPGMTSQDVIGRWEVSDHLIQPRGRNPPTHPFIEFHPDGTWTGSDGCNGLGGAWRVGEHGRMLATVGPQTAMGCDGAPVGAWLADSAWVGWGGVIPTEAESGSPLVLFDRNGQSIGIFRRA